MTVLRLEEERREAAVLRLIENDGHRLVDDVLVLCIASQMAEIAVLELQSAHFGHARPVAIVAIVDELSFAEVDAAGTNGAASKPNGKNSLEQLLLARNKKLTDELTVLRVSSRDLQGQLDERRRGLSSDRSGRGVENDAIGE